jgi:1-phosphofructokinase
MPVQRIYIITLNPAFDCVISVPGLRLHRVDLEGSQTSYSAGKGINVGKAMHCLGASTRNLVIAGKANASAFANGLRGLDTLIMEVPGEIRTNYTLSDPSDGSKTHIRTQGSTLAGLAIPELRDLLTDLSEGDWVVFSGSAPRDGTSEDWTALVELASNAGAFVAVDSSGRFFSDCVHSQPGLVKPNLAELREWSGDSLTTFFDVKSAAMALQAVTQGIVVLTLGPGGSVWIGPDGTVLSAVVREEPAGAFPRGVGCGDAYLAGLIVSMSGNASPYESIRLATGCAFAALKSTEPCIFDRQDAIRHAESCLISVGWRAVEDFMGVGLSNVSQLEETN